MFIVKASPYYKSDAQKYPTVIIIQKNYFVNKNFLQRCGSKLKENPSASLTLGSSPFRGGFGLPDLRAFGKELQIQATSHAHDMRLGR